MRFSNDTGQSIANRRINDGFVVSFAVWSIAGGIEFVITLAPKLGGRKLSLTTKKAFGNPGALCILDERGSSMPDGRLPTIPSAHVLLVDDSPTVRMVLAAELRDAGFRVTGVPTLDAARRALKRASTQNPVDLMILDLMLPDGHGIDFLQEVRTNPVFEKLPVMILSSDNRFTSMLQSLGIGADDFVGKPHSKAYLIGRARALTGARTSNGASTPKPWRILLVEHNGSFRQTLSQTLRVGHHCDVITLENADQAAQYLGLDDVRVDIVVVERRYFLRVLGLVQTKCPNGLPVIVLDDGAGPPRPRAGSPEDPGRTRAPVMLSKSLELNLIANAILERLHQDDGGNPRVASGSIPPTPRTPTKKIARGA